MKRFLLMLMFPLLCMDNKNNEIFRFMDHPPKKDLLSAKHGQVERFSLGIKFGLPYMAVVGAQYNLRLLSNQFAP